MADELYQPDDDDELDEPQPAPGEMPEGVEGNGARVPVALAATDQPVALHIEQLEDERTPEGMICMGTFRGERLIARCVMPPEAYDELEEFGIFEEPVPVVLVAQEAAPGLQCRLFAMIELPEAIEGEDEEDDEEGGSEPWAASVPSSGYEAAVREQAAEAELEDEEDDEEEEDEEEEADEGAPHLVPLPLGNIVRYDRDRVHPESLAQEAMDILQKVIDGRTYEVVDRALADLLGL